MRAARHAQHSEHRLRRLSESGSERGEMLLVGIVGRQRVNVRRSLPGVAVVDEQPVFLPVALRLTQRIDSRPNFCKPGFL
jgi:hypothetical protein